MSLTSYAAHFEDLLLWRALRQVEGGQYLDAGAGDPLQGSATQLFYARGWRGINLEPASAPLRQLRIARPADINLPLAAAAAEGTADFYEVSGTPLSTLDGALARQYREQGREVVLRQAALRTLDQVCAEHLDGPLHFLHLGMDDPAAALAGFDLQRWQPWLVVLRAPAGAAQLLLQAAGYTLAYQDGWKQYFVAPQQQALAAALQLPPNPDDDWQLAEGHARSFPLDEWRQRTAAAEAEAATSRTWAMAHVEEWKYKYTQMEEQRERADQLQAELKRVRAIADEQASRLEHDRQHYLEQRAEMARTLAAGQADVAAVYASLSWRVTKPLRAAKFVLTRGPRWALRQPGRVRGVLVRGARRVLGAALRYVNARPKLTFFLRRTVSRLPFLLPLARMVHMRLKHSQANGAGAADGALPADAGAPADLSQLPDAARRMFKDLRRSAPHS
jgi:hypothetical protein